MSTKWPSEKRSAPKPNEKAEWLILDAVEHADRRKHLLGAVVPQSVQYSPFDNYSPHWGDIELDKTMTVKDKQVPKREVLRKTMDGLWTSNQDYGEDQPKTKKASRKSNKNDQKNGQDESKREDQPVQLTDILTGKVAAKTAAMQARVTDLFNGFIRKNQAQEVEIKSGLVKRYKIDNPGAKVDDNLMACDPWREQLQKLFNRTSKDNTRFLLVTGILVCEDLEVRWKRGQTSDVGVSAKVDGKAVLAAAGVPPNLKLAEFLDSEFSFNQEKSDSENVFAKCNHGVIFAIRYNYLELDSEKTPNMFQKYILRAYPEGTIKHAKMDGVVLGIGVHAFADAKDQDGIEHDGYAVKEDEKSDGDWFYTRPSRNLARESGEIQDHADSDVQ